MTLKDELMGRINSSSLFPPEKYAKLVDNKSNQSNVVSRKPLNTNNYARRTENGNMAGFNFIRLGYKPNANVTQS